MASVEFSELQKKLAERFDAKDLALVERAFAFADAAHQGQTRKSEEPFITHPLTVANTLADWQMDAATIAAALLHDVPEDTTYTIADVKKQFGDEIAKLVDGVTKLGHLKLKLTYEETLVENLRKMFFAMAQDIRVILIKLADRLHNMETLASIPAEKQKRIAKETLEIYASIANRLGMGEVKGRLEDLSFPYVYPEEYKIISAQMKEHMEERKAHLASFTKKFRDVLLEHKITPLDIHGRAKHLYSLFQKAKRLNMDVGKIFDLLALRVVLKDIPECYAAIGAIHHRFKPVPGLFKDYIANPKPNGYRSLHTTIWDQEGKVFEIQLRTPAMHEEAEYGITAHWAYTESNKPQQGVLVHQKKYHWVQQLRRWQEEVAGKRSPKEILERLRIDFFRNRIFVFTPKGDVIDLPEGATPLDFAFTVHTDLGRFCQGAKVNDKMVRITEPLHNGDVVEIIKAKKPAKISDDWLKAVKTSLARSKIRHILKKGK
jgi:GTP pyrophosphokinase